MNEENPDLYSHDSLANDFVYALMQMAGGHHVERAVRKLKVVEREEKSCLRCGKKHKHNNSWCSPECCKQWKIEHKK